jgi:D-alanine-D-alanine ligase
MSSAYFCRAALTGNTESDGDPVPRPPDRSAAPVPRAGNREPLGCTTFRVVAERIRVAVVFGGRSGEHAISCISAASVLRALDRDRYEVLPVGILPDGRWVLAPDDPEALELRDGKLPAVAPGSEIAVVPGGWHELAAHPSTGLRDLGSVVDVVFPVLHGPYGEDGSIQGLLQLAGIPYVGAGIFASAAGMDKQHMKTLLAAAGLPVGPYTVLRPGDPIAAPGEGPWFVKPARAGSSLGITKVGREEDLGAAIDEARRHDPKVLVEAMIVGREIECGVLDGCPPRASVLAEIHVDESHPFYDFEAKYLDGASRFEIPAQLDPHQADLVRALALRAFEALDCAGLARVDFFLTAAGPVVNEINTMPGFTPQSIYPRMWAASGVPYPELVGELVELALRRGAGLR